MTRTILVVEPDDMERRIVENWVRTGQFDSTGMTVEVTGDYSVALATLRGRYYDYTHLGIEASNLYSQRAALGILKELQKANISQGMIVVFCTAPFEDEESVKKVAFALGARGYVREVGGYTRPERFVEMAERFLQGQQKQDRPWWKR